jgi:FixJ family two-component response regulator
MAEATSIVIVIDDDPAIRESIGGLLRSVGLRAKLFASVDEFLNAGRPDGPACLVLDVRLPGRSGLDFQRELAAANIQLPIIFMTGYGDIPMSVKAMKGGAIEFLTKPFRDQDLLDDPAIAFSSSSQDEPGVGRHRGVGREPEGSGLRVAQGARP